MNPDLALLLLAVTWLADLVLRVWHLLPRERSVFS